jgi:hypothetical protein
VEFGVRTPSLPAGGLLIWVGRQGWLQRPKPPSLSSPLLPPCCAPAAANRVGSVCATLTYLPGPAAAAEISTHSRNSPPPSVHTDRPVEPAPVGGLTASRRAGACGQTEPEEWVPPPTSGASNPGDPPSRRRRRRGPVFRRRAGGGVLEAEAGDVLLLPPRKVCDDRPPPSSSSRSPPLGSSFPLIKREIPPSPRPPELGSCRKDWSLSESSRRRRSGIRRRGQLKSRQIPGGFRSYGDGDELKKKKKMMMISFTTE